MRRGAYPGTVANRDTPRNSATFWRLLGFLRPYKLTLNISIVLAFISQAGTLAFPLLTGEVVTAIQHDDHSEVKRLIGIVLVIGVVKAICTLFRRLISGQQALGVELDLRNALYAKLVRLSFGYFDRHQTGQLMSRATVDLQSVRFFLGYGLIFFFQHSFTVLGVGVLLFIYSWQLALIVLALSPAIIALAYRYSHVSHPVLRDVQQKMADVATVAEENVVGVHVVKAFAQEQAEQDKFEARSEALFRQSVYANRQRAFYVPLLAFLPLLSQAAVLLVGGAMVVDKSMSLGDFVAFNLLLAMVVFPLRMLGMWIGEGQRATASGERIFQILDEPEEIGDRPGAGTLPAGPGRVRFEDVTFAFQPGRPVLFGIDLELEPEKTVALIGHTGAGKTSLASLIPRFYDVESGRVTIDGADVRDVSLTSLRREIGIIAQDPFLFSASVRDNLTFGRPEATDEEIRAGGAARPGARVHRAAARGLRDGDRRARRHALGRPAPAARDRARPRRRSADPDPRRRDRLGRRHDRGADQARPARGDAGPHDGDRRPPPLDDRPRRRDRRARPRPGRRPGNPRGGARRERGLPRDLRAWSARGRDRRAGGGLDGAAGPRGRRGRIHRRRRAPRAR